MRIEAIQALLHRGALWLDPGCDVDDICQNILCKAIGYPEPIESRHEGYWWQALRNEITSLWRSRRADVSLDALLEDRPCRRPELVEDSNVEAYAACRELLSKIPGRTIRLALTPRLNGAQRVMLLRDRRKLKELLDDKDLLPYDAQGSHIDEAELRSSYLLRRRNGRRSQPTS